MYRVSSLLNTGRAGQHKINKHRSLFHKVACTYQGKELSLETGRMARLADGAVFARYGGTSLLATAVPEPYAADEVKDYLALQVEYREKSFAAGFIPTTYTRREMGTQDREVLGSRIIDRTLRPLFPKGYVKTTQIVCTLLSSDQDCDPEFLSIVASSAALRLSSIPFNGPAGAVKVGYVDGQYILNPDLPQRDRSQLNLLFAGTADQAVMIEADAEQLPGPVMAEALCIAQEAMSPLIELQHELSALAAVPTMDYQFMLPTEEMHRVAHEAGYEHACHLMQRGLFDKKERARALDESQAIVLGALREAFGTEGWECKLFLKVWDDMLTKAYRDTLLLTAKDAGNAHVTYFPPSRPTQYKAVVPTKPRPDGRDSETVRPLQSEVDILPRVHGSALFSRGTTQSLCSTTLAPVQSAQTINRVTEGKVRKSFFLHYEFPPFSVNEVGRVGGLNRRAIGHGALAEKAVAKVMPMEQDFPYAIRATSDITASDGSSSMATVCGASLALMDAGVPLETPVAGISIGLVTPSDFGPGKPYALLTDILGMEDHHGDMDFKVAGTHKGITAIQMDVKLPGIPVEVLSGALQKADVARAHVLKHMEEVLAQGRSEVKAHGLRVASLPVPEGGRGRLVGPGGSHIKALEAATGVVCTFSNLTEEVHLYAEEGADMDKALMMAKEYLGQAFQQGEVVKVKVDDLRDFGAICSFGSMSSGLLHISELSHSRVNKVQDELTVGQELEVQILETDSMGKIKLSRKALLPKPETPEQGAYHPSYKREGGQGRGGKRGGNNKQSGGPRGGSKGKPHGGKTDKQSNTSSMESETAAKDAGSVSTQSTEVQSSSAEPKQANKGGASTEGEDAQADGPTHLYDYIEDNSKL